MPFICLGCRQPSDSLKRCTGCKSAMYCSKECQLEHWDEHKQACRTMQRMNQEDRDNGRKREVRLFKNWARNYRIEILLCLHYSVDKLTEIQKDEKMIMLDVDFDYNKRTYVPTNKPYLMDMDSDSFLPEYRQAIESTRDRSGDMVYMSLQHGTSIHTIGFPLTQLAEEWTDSVESFGYSYRSCCAKGDAWVPWEYMVEKYLPSFTGPLKSSVFDSWEPMQQENIRKQLVVLAQSSHYRPFISNALRLELEQPRHKSHLIKVQAKLGLGLGQIAALTDYQVLTPDEAKHYFKEKDGGELSCGWVGRYLKGCMDVENHPSILAKRKVDPNAVRLSILLETDTVLEVVSSFWSLPEGSSTTTGPDEDAVASQHAKCDAKARELFEEMKKIQFPTVLSPELH